MKLILKTSVGLSVGWIYVFEVLISVCPVLENRETMVEQFRKYVSKMPHGPMDSMA